MTIKEALTEARQKGMTQYILALICVGLCFPIGMAWAVIKIIFARG